jgi:tetratricopeptide (TPR) repeat protein
MGLEMHPDNLEILLNAGVCHSRAGNMERAIVHFRALLARDPENYVAMDGLCAMLSRQGNYAAAREAGTNALQAKDKAVTRALVRPAPTALKNPASTAKNLLSYSLFGSNPRYLRGALDNAIAAKHVYPGWQVRFYADDTVPVEVLDALEELGCEVLLERSGQSMRERLAWRFKVADDQNVGRFLVRDVDSIVSEREANAVAQWINSGASFHVMRDWWTHTDLILAGMWGGTAGVLPPIWPLLMSYQDRAMETANVDQWFLRDAIWPLIRSDVLVHDRFFKMDGAQSWPDENPEGNFHVGQDEFAIRREAQAERLADWIAQIPALQDG